MRKAAIAAVALLLAGGAGLVLLTARVDRYLEANRDRLAAQAAAALGREVGFAALAMSWRHGPGVRVEELRIAGTADEPLLEAATVTVVPDLVLALRGELVPARIIVVSPRLRVAAGDDGFAAAGFAAPAAAVGGLAAVPAGGSRRVALSPDGLGIRIVDATIVRVDGATEPPRATELPRFDAEAVVRPGEPFRIGGLRIDFEGLRIAAEELAVAAVGGAVELRRTEVLVNGAPVTIGGRFAAATGAWEVAGEIGGLGLGPVLDVLAPPRLRRIDGGLEASFALGGRGVVPAEAIDSITGTARVAVRDGVLRQLNVAEEVLQGMTGIPGLTGLVSAKVRARHPGLLEAADTPFDELTADLQAGAGRVEAERFSLAAAEHDLGGRGWVTFAGDVDVTATLRVAPERSDELVESVAELGALRDETGRLALPFQLKGRVGEARLQPDLEYVVRKMGKAALQGGLERLFGRKGDGREAEATPGSGERLLRRGLDALFGE